MEINVTARFEQCEHEKIRHSPNGVDIIEECEECCKAWIVKPTGEVWRLWNSSYETRLLQQKSVD